MNIAGVMPGFDNQFNAAWGAWKVELLDRKNGVTYTQVWEQYLRDRDVIDAVLIPTWSDHTEGSGIEPMAPYGDREARATAKYSAQFKGLADTSASLDFTLPKELFDLRKLAKFLESAGYPSSALSADRALLDSAAYDIAAGAYANAATKLSTTRTNLDIRRTNGIRTTTYTSQYFTGGAVTVANGADQYINIADATADLVRSKNFDGVITFEYLDDSTFAANKTLYLLSYPAPANTGKPGENRSIQMQMRHGNGDGQWKTARVALNKKNLRLDHHVTSGALPIDLYFSALGGASNGGRIRNVTVSLTTYEYTGNGAKFSDWATDSGIPGELPEDDFDHDGIANLMEYALGLNPTAPSASPGTFDGSTISFNKGSAAVANGDLTYAIQTSTTLAAGSWTTVTPTVNSPSLISYTLPTGLTKIFARLLVAKIN